MSNDVSYYAMCNINEEMSVNVITIAVKYWRGVWRIYTNWPLVLDDEAPSSERSDEYCVFDISTPSGGHNYVMCGAIWRLDERYIR